jgi:hypothetical protein
VYSPLIILRFISAGEAGLFSACIAYRASESLISPAPRKPDRTGTHERWVLLRSATPPSAGDVICIDTIRHTPLAIQYEHSVHQRRLHATISQRDRPLLRPLGLPAHPVRQCHPPSSPRSRIARSL